MENELYHHGILGMKWGVRRFQNKDGTLTNAGKARYNTDGGNNTTKKEAKPQKKSVSEMSDKELQDAINRLRNEQLYAQLTAPKPNKLVQAGKRAVLGAIESSGKWFVSKMIENYKSEQQAEQEKARDKRARELIDSHADPTKMSSKDLQIYNDRIKKETTAFALEPSYREKAFADEKSRMEAKIEQDRYEAWLKGRSMLNRSGYK